MTGRALWALALAALPACRAWPTPPAVPALVTHATAASRADLKLALAQALGGAPVRLADDALTRQSLLIIGRAQARGVNGVPLNGRELGHPQHFRLLEQGSHCVLLHLETGKSRVLPHTSCHASPDGNSRN